MFEGDLQKIGLTSGESRVYLALIFLGPGKIGPIVQRSRVSYSKIYSVLDRLVRKGLVSFIYKQRTRYFQAVDPSRLIEYVKRQEAEIGNRKKILSEIIPNLNKSLKSVENILEAEIFVGQKGLMAAFDSLLCSAKRNEVMRFFYKYDIVTVAVSRSFFTRANFFDKINFYFKKMHIRWRGIVSNEKKRSKIPPHTSQRYVDFPILGNVDIIGDKILLISWKEKPLGILIHSQEIAENFKDYFDNIWKLSN
jgi:sugar-specific transcriptional regulator TrmB